MTMTNYVDERNTTLLVLEGAVDVRGPEHKDAVEPEAVVRLVSGEALDVAAGQHAVTTVSATPSGYLYVATTAAVADNNSDPVRPATQHRHIGPARGCSDACYAFAFDAVKAAFSAIF